MESKEEAVSLLDSELERIISIRVAAKVAELEKTMEDRILALERQMREVRLDSTQEDEEYKTAKRRLKSGKGIRGSDSDQEGEENGVIGVNVGGKVFFTLRSTLCKYPSSFLGAMFGGMHFNYTDREGNYFIDRNPKYFKHILNFLRQGVSPKIKDLPEDKKQALMEEVEYYGLTEWMFPEETAKQLCEQGYAFAKGDGVPRDIQRAITFLERAASLGDPKAQNRLAMCYYSGEGVEQNYKLAVALYEQAARQGLAWAQYNLGLCFKNGYGVDANEDMARMWFCKAAEQGHVKARQKLASES